MKSVSMKSVPTQFALTFVAVLSAISSVNARPFDIAQVQCVESISNAVCNTDTVFGEGGCFNSVVCKSTVTYKNQQGLTGIRTFSASSCYGLKSTSPMSDAISALDQQLQPLYSAQSCN